MMLLDLEEFLGIPTWVSVTPRGKSVTAHIDNMQNEPHFKVQLCHLPQSDLGPVVSPCGASWFS